MSGAAAAAGAAAAHAWRWHTSAIAWFQTGQLPVLGGVAVNELGNALLAAAFLRAQMARRVHWYRALLSTFIIGVGGSTLVSLLFGVRPPWLANPAVFKAVLLAYWLAFQCPGDAFMAVYRQPVVRPLIDGLRGVALVYSIGERGREGEEGGKGARPRARACGCYSCVALHVCSYAPCSVCAFTATARATLQLTTRTPHTSRHPVPPPPPAVPPIRHTQAAQSSASRARLAWATPWLRAARGTHTSWQARLRARGACCSERCSTYCSCRPSSTLRRRGGEAGRRPRPLRPCGTRVCIRFCCATRRGCRTAPPPRLRRVCCAGCRCQRR